MSRGRSSRSSHNKRMNMLRRTDDWGRDGYLAPGSPINPRTNPKGWCYKLFGGGGDGGGVSCDPKRSRSSNCRGVGGGGGGGGGRGEGGNGRSIIRPAVTALVKEFLTQPWNDGAITKDQFKVIAKKAVEKVLSAIPDTGKGSVENTHDGVEAWLIPSRKLKIKALMEGYGQVRSESERSERSERRQHVSIEIYTTGAVRSRLDVINVVGGGCIG